MKGKFQVIKKTKNSIMVEESKRKYHRESDKYHRESDKSQRQEFCRIGAVITRHTFMNKRVFTERVIDYGLDIKFDTPSRGKNPAKEVNQFQGDGVFC